MRHLNERQYREIKAQFTTETGWGSMDRVVTQTRG